MYKSESNMLVDGGSDVYEPPELSVFFHRWVGETHIDAKYQPKTFDRVFN